MKQLEIEGMHDLVLAKLDRQLLPEHWNSQLGYLLCCFAPRPHLTTPNSSMSFSNPPDPPHPCPHACPPELPTLRCSIQQTLIIYCHYIRYSLNYITKVGFFTHLVIT